MKDKRFHYSEKVDPHIYGVTNGAGCQKIDNWIDLAIAALDQGGFSVHSQSLIRDELYMLAEQEKLN